MTKIAILIACYNRRELTLQAIRAAKDATPPGVDLAFFVTDDASNDGTSACIQAEFPDVTVLSGTGDLYWNGGMRLAWEAALNSNPDFFLWLNDDLALNRTSLDDLLARWHEFSADHRKIIVVGYTTHPATGEITYGGLRRGSRISRLRFRRLHPDEVHCDTMNGNCVLIPNNAVADIGINSAHYTHSFGDMDYGLRAHRAGYHIVQSRSPVGAQAQSESYASPRSLALADLISFASHPKGMPIKEWLHFCREHGGWIWPVNFALMYIKPIFQPPLRQGT